MINSSHTSIVFIVILVLYAIDELRPPASHRAKDNVEEKVQTEQI